MMTPTDIKSLAIALEALSRIPKIDDLSTRIETLLIKAINQVEDHHTVPAYSRPPRAPDDEHPI